MEIGGREVPGSRFSHRRRVQFSETDAAGLVHFTCFFRYLEDAEHALWRDVGLSINPENGPVGWPRVSASCEFIRPLKFEQEFEVEVRIIEITNRTITYAGEIARNGERVARGTWKIACVTKQPDGSIRSTEIPSIVTERLKPYVDPTSTLHPPSATLHPPTSA